MDLSPSGCALRTERFLDSNEKCQPFKMWTDKNSGVCVIRLKGCSKVYRESSTAQKRGSGNL
jgi:hypothetical protein